MEQPIILEGSDPLSETTSTSEEPEHHGGRPLDTSRDVALREAALELLAEIGYDRLTIDAVAARARSSKATIYRRWPGKAELVVDALKGLKGPPQVPNTGSLQADLTALAQGSTSTDSRFDAQLMLGLITALTHDVELRQVVRDRLIDPRHAAFKAVFEQASTRGEIGEVPNLDLLVSVFPALIIQHLLVFGEIPDADFAQHVVRDLILPMAVAPTNTPRA